MSDSSESYDPESTTLELEIDPDLQEQAEELFADCGLTLEEAIDLFLRESLKANGLPFQPSPENKAYRKAKAVLRLMAEVEEGWQSAASEGWISLDEVEARLGICQ